MPQRTVTITIHNGNGETYSVQLNYGQKVSDLVHLLGCMGKNTSSLTNVHGKQPPLSMPLRGDLILYEK